MISTRPILCLDFDGVCHSYISGWQGATVIPDPPVDGLFEFLLAVHRQGFFEINIYSSRSSQPGGIEAMRRWFGKEWAANCLAHDIVISFMEQPLCPDWIHFPTEKPPFYVALDDRVLTFNGVWPNVEALSNFKSWQGK